ncbi:MAG: hypothetical protein M0P95_17730 [Sulfuritalea sp.]|nr:hypothetical protein [Sulfuritalea sp.]
MSIPTVDEKIKPAELTQLQRAYAALQQAKAPTEAALKACLDMLAASYDIGSNSHIDINSGAIVRPPVEPAAL